MNWVLALTPAGPTTVPGLDYGLAFGAGLILGLVLADVRPNLGVRFWAWLHHRASDHRKD